MFATFGSRSHQQGMGFLGMVVIIALAAFFVTIALKVGPLYLNYWTVRSIMEETAKQPDSLAGGARGILASIDKRLNINSVENVSSKDFSVQKIQEGTYSLTLDYESRVHLFFNIDAVAVFGHQVEVRLE
jgi:hypothetical protein